MVKKLQLVGMVFGNLTVISEAESGAKRKNSRFECLCSCGKVRVVWGHSLVSGNTKSCGCIRVEKLVRLYTKHNHCSSDWSSTYNSWMHMKQRCLNSKNKNYQDYGGRGISVCERWNIFENFLEDMGEMPENGSIERIDVNGNYNKENCKWIDRGLQARNTRKTVLSEEIVKNIRLERLAGKSRKQISELYSHIKIGTIDGVLYSKVWA